MVSMLPYLLLIAPLFVGGSLGNPTPVSTTPRLITESADNQPSLQTGHVTCRDEKGNVGIEDFVGENEASPVPHDTSYGGASDHAASGRVAAEIRDATPIRTARPTSRSLTPTMKKTISKTPNLDKRQSGGLAAGDIINIGIGVAGVIVAITAIAFVYFGWERRRSYFARLCGR
ncbi:hypothetical protein F4805DRAFT_380771 [Annulohypoxylon moriforme]|nr:hypothetical protein F4805DRAFT_380771 [Annulohypoxylon moriforme]